MGTLKQMLPPGRRFPLGVRCLIGRHEGCDVRVQHPRVSGEHASLHWTGECWELRDLGSRNGTALDGRRLAPGERARLEKGARIELGGTGEGFWLIDAAPPEARAVNVASGLVRVATGGVLVIPDDEQPEVTIFEGRDGRWIAEWRDEQRTLADRAIVTVNGEGWALDLPSPTGPTLDGAAAGPTLETIALRFEVSPDEEHVDATVLYAGEETRLPPRSYHYLLLTLARARLADRGAASAEEGWVDREMLCRRLAMDANKLHVDIFRARKQLGALGILGAAGIVARRPGAGQLRLGTGRVEVIRRRGSRPEVS